MGSLGLISIGLHRATDIGRVLGLPWRERRTLGCDTPNHYQNDAPASISGITLNSPNPELLISSAIGSKLGGTDGFRIPGAAKNNR